MTTTAPDAPPADAAASTTPRSRRLLVAFLVFVAIVVAVAVLVVGRPWGVSGAGEAVLASLDTDRVHAVYLSTDIVYFGVVTDARGDFFTLGDAFFLRATPGEDGDDAQPQGLVPVAVSDEVGGDGDLLVNANEVVRIQTLTPESEIARAIRPR
jgi:hypothetical protein